MIPILFEHPHFLLVNKPAGLFTQAAPGVPSLQVELQDQIRKRDEHQGNPFIGLPHRLDRGTTGILLIARNQRALKRFGQQFQARQVTKTYIAIVHGEFPESLECVDYLKKIPNQPRAEVCDQSADGAREARLRARKLHCASGYSLVQIELLTGRMHQIRLQLSSRGFPIVGDEEYRADKSAQERDTQARNAAQGSIALHALRLEFRHPQNGQLTIGTAPLPEHWESLCPALDKASVGAVARSGKDDGSHLSQEGKSWTLA